MKGARGSPPRRKILRGIGEWDGADARIKGAEETACRDRGKGAEAA
jgi:hypothetical protein